MVVMWQSLFQSALPMKGATCGLEIREWQSNISIRAPNERSDVYYYPDKNKLVLFQSALPMKGATMAAR